MNKIKLLTVIGLVLLTASSVDAKMLAMGSRGDAVASLQGWLIENGYPIPLIQNGVADFGYFGSQTRDAVKMYQEDKGIATTGVIDSESYANVKLGSVSGPDTYFTYTANNDLQKYGLTKGLLTSTTTVCAIRSPQDATTTGWGAITLTRSSTTASLVTIARATTAYATTTAIATSTVAANAQVSFTTSSTTPAQSQSDVAFRKLFSPGEYMVFGMQDTSAEETAGSFSPLGRCSAEFIRI